MSAATKFREQLSALTSEISRDNKPVVLMGAGRGGWYTAKVLAHHGIKIAAFTDSNPAKHGAYHGTDVLPLQAATDKFPDAVFLPCLLAPKHVDAVTTTLRTAGANDVRYFMPHILFSYYTEVANRKVNHQALADSIAGFYSRDGGKLTQSPSLSYVITQKCTLCCKDCGAFVPDNAAPATYPASRIIDDIRKYCSAFDFVHHIALQGGEPFLHREISEIVEQVSCIPNLLFVDFVTNGTLVPKKSALESMAQNGACVIISDYGPASTEIAPLSEACERNGIFVDYYVYDANNEWGTQTPILERKRGIKENDRVFQDCISNPMICCQIMDGKVHRCSFSNFASGLGFVPEFKDDFVDLAHYEAGSAELSEKVLHLAYRKTALHVCDYCPGEDRVLVPAGIQISRPKKTRKTAAIYIKPPVPHVNIK